ncbi:MAG: hypothetical protein HGA90_06025 [Alphaproteobacteria bacterium]|nr:hypothetical protein [Alphaproteobacteria bacterium]
MFLKRAYEFIRVIALLAQRGAEFHRALGKIAGLAVFEQGVFAFGAERVAFAVNTKHELLLFRVVHQNEGIAPDVGGQITPMKPLPLGVDEEIDVIL